MEKLWTNLVQVSRRWFQPLRIQEDNGRAVSGGRWIWVTRTLGKLHELPVLHDSQYWCRPQEQACRLSVTLRVYQRDFLRNKPCSPWAGSLKRFAVLAGNITALRHIISSSS